VAEGLQGAEEGGPGLRAEAGGDGRHSGEAFYALDDPLEAAVFSVMVEMMKRRAEGEDKIKEIEIE
jgi:hypothetical protein